MLGAGGRLGHALAAQAPPERLRGLSRRPADARAPGWIQGDRHDGAALAAVIDGCAAVIDLCAFDLADAAALSAAWAVCARPPTRLVWASSLAERPLAAWARDPAGDDALLDGEPTPSDRYGAGKRACRQHYVASLGPRGVAVTTVLLPRIVATNDPTGLVARWRAAAAAGQAIDLPGGGSQRPCQVSDRVAAAALWALATRPAALPGPWQLAPAHRPTLAAQVAAWLGPASAAARLRWHQRDAEREVSGGDEDVDGAPLRAALPDLPW